MRAEIDDKVLQQLIRATPEELSRLLRGAAAEITNEIKLSFGTGPDGRTYTRGSVQHTASAPGYPPNVDVGSLSGSIRWEAESDDRVLVMDGVEYGVYLEEGTANMAARPFVNPVFEDWRAGKFARYLADVIK